MDENLTLPERWALLHSKSVPTWMLPVVLLAILGLLIGTFAINGRFTFADGILMGVFFVTFERIGFVRSLERHRAS